ncbi:MAG: 30S ribosomal protein S20 [Bacteroidales bacterium]|jgi:small subunit ribosomal protein S20|nr:30S ribosomal protein S20 [Bacteroidales bacterium]
MANHISAEKRIRNTKTKRTQNRYQGRTVRNSVKKLRDTEEKEVLVKEISAVVSKIDKLAKKSVIHKNKAANLKSKLMRKANAASPATPAAPPAEK